MPCRDNTQCESEVKCSDLISYVNQEIEQIHRELEQRRSLVASAIKLYGIALGGFLATISVGINTSIVTNHLWSKAYGFFGILCVTFMLLVGACFMVFLGYNFQRILIAKKNRLSVRELFIKSYSTCLNIPPDKFLLEPHLKNIPKTEINSQYWIVSINCIVSITLIYFLRFIVNNWFIAIDIGILIGIVLTLLFPRLSVNYARYVIIGKALEKYRNIREIRKAYRKWYKRCKSLKKTKILMWTYRVTTIICFIFIFRSLYDYSSTISPKNIYFNYAHHALIIIFFLSSVILKFYETTPSHYPSFGSFLELEKHETV